MAIRRRIAETISRTKERAGLETPIIDEVPLPAELPRVFELPRGVIPSIVRGTAYGRPAGRWYRVTFPHPMVDPRVVAVAEGRSGKRPIAERVPSIKELEKVLKEKIPDLTIPKWEIHIPTADDFKKLVRDFLGDWGAFNFIRDWIADGFGGFEYWIWDALFRPRFLEKVWDKFSDFQDGVNSRLTNIRDTLNEKLSDIDDRLETLRSKVNTSLGTLFPRLYKAWGQRADMALTVANVRNITSTGFEFLSMGDTRIHYIAIGGRR